MQKSMDVVIEILDERVARRGSDSRKDYRELNGT